MSGPSLRCVLQHWYELRLPGQNIGSENNKRFTDIRSMHMMGRRRGADALRGAVVGAAKGERAPERGMLVVGAGLFPDDLVVEAYVRRVLHSEQHLEFRIAATYASVFFLQRSEEVASQLAEWVLLGEGEQLLVLAARDVLGIWAATKNGGTCSSGHPARTTSPWPPAWRSSFDWMPVRVSPTES